jgi:hypothetical protein
MVSKRYFHGKGRCLVMQSAHPGQTGLTGVPVGLAVHNLLKPRQTFGESLLLSINMIQGALEI